MMVIEGWECSGCNHWFCGRDGDPWTAGDGPGGGHNNGSVDNRREILLRLLRQVVPGGAVSVSVCDVVNRISATIGTNV